MQGDIGMSAFALLLEAARTRTNLLSSDTDRPYATAANVAMGHFETCHRQATGA
jgi:hypothetical protein